MARQSKTISRVKDLKPDPRNARAHPERNIGIIAGLLQDVGAARSIVIDEDGMVLAGNGVLSAAARAGIDKVKVVDADGKTLIAVRRAGLTPRQKAQLAIGDNRSNELSDWDLPMLTGLADEVGLDLADVGFTPEELIQLGRELVEGPSGQAAPGAVPVGESFQVVIECRDEDEQRAIHDRMTQEGYRCRVLTL